MLTQNEKLLVADALNGCNVSLTCDPHWLALMVGEQGAIRDAAVIGTDAEGRAVITGSTMCSGLELEIYDAIRLNRLDEKWAVSSVDLLRKLREMLPAQRERLVRVIAGCWERNDQHFWRDLAALETGLPPENPAGGPAT